MSLLLQMLHVPLSTATNCQADKSFTHKLWHLLAVCFVFLLPFRMVRFSWQVRLACCFFLERGDEWFFWQHRLPDHLLKAVVLTSTGEPEQLLHSPEVRSEAGITPCLAHACSPARTAGATTYQLAVKRRIQLHKAAAAGLCWFTDSASTAKGGGWCILRHIQDDCHRNISGENRPLSTRLLHLFKSVKWVSVHASLQCEDSSLLQKQEVKCYQSKLGILYTNYYTIQTSYLYFNKLPSLEVMEGRKFQDLKGVLDITALTIYLVKPFPAGGTLHFHSDLFSWMCCTRTEI